LRGRIDREHAELRLAGTGDLAERPAVGHERHGSEHASRLGGDEHFGVTRAPCHIAQHRGVLGVGADERAVRGHAQFGDGRELGGDGGSDLERHGGGARYEIWRAVGFRPYGGAVRPVR